MSAGPPGPEQLARGSRGAGGSGGGQPARRAAGEGRGAWGPTAGECRRGEHRLEGYKKTASDG